MKKIILFFSILLLSNISGVKALEKSVYYSNYGEWSDYSKDNYRKTELMDVEVERRYKWFKNKERGEYLDYDDGFSKYDYINSDEYKYSDFSEWQQVVPDEKNDRVIETKNKYLVKKIKPIKNIYIKGVFKTNEVDLNQIIIYNNGEKINYNPVCGDCSGMFKLQSEIGILILELDDFYYLDNISIIINPVNIDDIDSLYFLVTSPDENSNSETIFYSAIYKKDSFKYIHMNIYNFVKKYPIYEEEIYYDYPPSFAASDYMAEVKFYRYKDKQYYFYSYDKEYVDGYLKNKEGYEKDENDYLDYFRYRNRDKLELVEYVEIKSKDERLDDYISSTTQYTVEGDIDYKKNGLYHVKVKSYFITKDVSVLVNINENEKDINNSDEELLIKYKDLEDKYNDLLKEKSEYENNNKITDIDNNKVIQDYNDCEIELKKATLKNNDNEKKLRLSNQAYDYLSSSLLKINSNDFQNGLNWYLWLLFLILLLLIMIIIIWKKRKNKNKF